VKTVSGQRLDSKLSIWCLVGGESMNHMGFDHKSVTTNEIVSGERLMSLMYGPTET